MGTQINTWNPINKANNVTLSNDNLTAWNVSNAGTVISLYGVSSGKYYHEITVDGGFQQMIGVSNGRIDLNATGNFTKVDVRFYYYTGKKFPNNSSYGSEFTVNDVISILLDMDLGTIEFWKNGVSQGVA
ncbi:SPRY domain-containing protein, partial [Streptomyces sp. NPDC057927]